MNDIEEDGGGSATAGNQEEDGFARMMKEFNQDAEEKEYEAAKEEEDQEEEEATRAVAPKVPIKPSQEEVNEHMLTHLPFRSWCVHGVKGKAVGKVHRCKKVEDSTQCVILSGLASSSIIKGTYQYKD